MLMQGPVAAVRNLCEQITLPYFFVFCSHPHEAKTDHLYLTLPWPALGGVGTPWPHSGEGTS